MFRVKVRREGKWTMWFTTADFDEVIEQYNAAPVPKMLITGKGIAHKQYTPNNFYYDPRVSK